MDNYRRNIGGPRSHSGPRRARRGRL